MATKHIHNEQIDQDRRGSVDFNPGDRIAWQYEHSISRRHSTTITRFGVYHGRVKHTRHYRGDQLALVTFDTASGNARKPIDDLYHVKPIDPTKPIRFTMEV